MRKKSIAIVFLVGILVILMTVIAPASGTRATPNDVVCYVKWDASGSNNGTSWTHAYNGQLGVHTALADATCTQIWVAQGTYIPGTNRADSFQLKNGVAIYGGFDGTEDSLNNRFATGACFEYLADPEHDEREILREAANAYAKTNAHFFIAMSQMAMGNRERAKHHFKECGSYAIPGNFSWEMSNAFYLKYQPWYEKRFGPRPIVEGAECHGKSVEKHLGFYPAQ